MKDRIALREPFHSPTDIYRQRHRPQTERQTRPDTKKDFRLSERRFAEKRRVSGEAAKGLWRKEERDGKVTANRKRHSRGEVAH